MDESRKQFEAEVLRRAETSGYAHMASVLNKTSDGGYATTWVDMMWEGWQASRAAIEIELPDVEDPANFFCGVYSSYAVRLAIESTGIKLKGA